MKILKLFPLDPDSSDWRCSTHKGVAIVRADNEDQARDIARDNLNAIAKQESSCEKTPSSPWTNEEVVGCVPLDDSPYSIDGPPKLLEPTE